MTDAPDIQINPAARVQLRHYGREENPLVVIDDLLLNPDDLVEYAAQTPFSAPDSVYYPGLNAPLPPSYLHTLIPVLRMTIARAFRTGPQELIARAFFALSTKSVEEMVPLQKIPHYDQHDPRAIAMVHYLAHEQKGGTGFFRHRTSGFESVDTSRRVEYMAQITGELENATLTAYTGADTPNYEMIDSVEPKFNRAILYRSNVLHCALFDGARLSSDPRTGRLTANSFFVPA